MPSEGLAEQAGVGSTESTVTENPTIVAPTGDLLNHMESIAAVSSDTIAGVFQPFYEDTSNYCSSFIELKKN